MSGTDTAKLEDKLRTAKRHSAIAQQFVLNAERRMFKLAEAANRAAEKVRALERLLQRAYDIEDADASHWYTGPK